MLEERTVQEMVGVIVEKILTPVIYMYEDEAIEFVCFCDGNTPIQDFHDVEHEIFTKFGVNIEIVDIREFDTGDRWEIITNAELVYMADEVIKAAFEHAMLADMEKLHASHNEIIERYSVTGSYYAH